MDCVDDYIDKNCSHCNQPFTPEYLSQQKLKIIRKWYIYISSCYADEVRRNQDKGIFNSSDPNWEGALSKRYKEFMRKYEAELMQLGILRKRI